MTGSCHPLLFALLVILREGVQIMVLLAYFFLPPVTPSILTPRILNALFLNSLIFCSSREVRDQDSLPWKAKCKVICTVPVALYTSMLASCMHCPPTCFRRSQYNIITFLVKRRHAVYVWRNTEVHLPNHCCHGKAIYITYSECVFVVLVIQHTMRMRCVMLTSVACPTLPYFSTLSHKSHDFRKIFIEHKMCVFILS